MERETMEYDVVIVGGGPSGLATAIKFAQLNQEMCTEMVAEDLKVAKRHAFLKANGHDIHLSMEEGR